MKKYIYIILILLSGALKAAQPCAENPFYKKNENEAFLANAVFYGILDEVKELLQEGVKIKMAFHSLENGLDYQKITLNVAQQIANSLLNHGFDINELNDADETPLIQAIKKRNIKAVRLFVKLGGTKYINGVNNTNIPIFHLLNDDFRGIETYEIFNLLISLGVDLNITNNFDNTPLYVAVENLNKKLSSPDHLRFSPPSLSFLKNAILMLLINGSNIQNKTILDYLKNNPESVAKKFFNFILEAEGLDEIKGAENALLIAAYLNNPDLVNALLRKGVWFRSKTNELYFNNLIEDKPEIRAMINQYKLERDYVISENPNLIPDLSKIVSEY